MTCGKMNVFQKRKVNGGSWTAIGAVVGIICLGVYIYDNWDRFVDGVEAGYKAVRG